MVLIFHVDLQNRAYEIKTFKWARNKVHREKVNFLILYISVTKQYKVRMCNIKKQTEG